MVKKSLRKSTLNNANQTFCLIQLLRYFALVVLVFYGLLVIVGLFPFLKHNRRWSIVSSWARGVVAVLGVRVLIYGKPPENGPFFTVCNHISWLDIPIVHSFLRVNFIAKADVRRWPIIGFLASRAGTVFIERRRVRDLKNVGKVLENLILSGESVFLFPEGTTSRGDDVLPFRSSLLQVAVNSNIAVLPVSIRYLTENHTMNYKPAYVANDSFFDTLSRIVASPKTFVELRVLETVNPSNFNRRALATLLRERIQSSFSA